MNPKKQHLATLSNDIHRRAAAKKACFTAPTNFLIEWKREMCIYREAYNDELMSLMGEREYGRFVRIIEGTWKKY